MVLHHIEKKVVWIQFVLRVDLQHNPQKSYTTKRIKWMNVSAGTTQAKFVLVDKLWSHCISHIVRPLYCNWHCLPLS